MVSKPFKLRVRYRDGLGDGIFSIFESHCHAIGLTDLLRNHEEYVLAGMEIICPAPGGVAAGSPAGSRKGLERCVVVLTEIAFSVLVAPIESGCAEHCAAGSLEVRDGDIGDLKTRVESPVLRAYADFYLAECMMESEVDGFVRLSYPYRRFSYCMRR